MENTPESAPPHGINSLFMHSETDDPFSHYESMLQHQRVYLDESNEIWAIHGYQDCLRLLHSAGANIPPRPETSALSKTANGIADRLIRLSNAPTHTRSRPPVRRMLTLAHTPEAGQLLDELLPFGRGEQVIDWVDVVARKLPALSLLHGLGFKRADRDYLLDKVPMLTQLMKPEHSDDEASIVNTVVDEVLPVVARHIETTEGLRQLAHDHVDSAAEAEERKQLLEANLLGLLIQSHDAVRGLLSNVLLQVLKRMKHVTFRPVRETINQHVIETLRFDPPIHNTRRVLVQDMEIGGQHLVAGQHVLLVLAAANRDPQQFANPDQFEPARTNNTDHLTFGAGAHACMAKHLAVGLVTDTVLAMLERHPDLRLVENRLQYEPLINARLPQQVRISYSQ